MDNNEWPIHIHKQLTLEMDLRMCAGIYSNSEKQHGERGYTTGLFTIVWVHIHRFVCCKQENIRYCHLHFMMIAACRCRWQSMTALLQLTVIFIPIITQIVKITPSGAPRLKISTIYKNFKSIQVKAVQVLLYWDYQYCNIHMSLFSFLSKQTNKENTSLFVWLTCLARSRQAISSTESLTYF